MILHALHDFYQRRQADPDPARRLPAFGLEQREIPFILELDTAGALKAITDTRRAIGAKKVGTSFQVPMGVKKTSGVAANLLWDNAEYVLGVADAKKLEAATGKGKAEDYQARLGEMSASFLARIETLPQAAHEDPGIHAVLRFLADAPATQAARFEQFQDIAATNPVLTFRIEEDNALL